MTQCVKNPPIAQHLQLVAPQDVDAIAVTVLRGDGGDWRLERLAHCGRDGSGMLLLLHGEQPAQAQRGVDVATVWVRQRHDVARPPVNGEAGVCQGHPPSRGKPLLLATTPKRCVTPLVSRCVFGEEISCR